MSRKDTKTKILDAAEKLFAREGFHATSLRMLTSEAEVNLAAVNYHFGSKEELIKAVIERRLLPLNKLRIQKLQEIKVQAEHEGRRPGVREVVKAFIEPTFAFRKSGKGAQDFITLIGRSISEPDGTVRKIFHALVMPVFQLLNEMLCEALPDLPKEIIYWRIHFTLGAMAHALNITQMCQMIPDGLVLKVDTVSFSEQFMNFVINGLEAPI
jgi:AcrR family transcriptional regulator